MSDGALPPRETMLAELRDLREVSVELERLTGLLADGQRLAAHEQASLERLTAEQARLVDAFVARAGHTEAVQKYQQASAILQSDMQALLNAQDEGTLSSLRDRLGAEVETCVNALRDVIGGVVSRA